MSVLIPTMIGKHHLKLDMPGEFSNKVLQKCLTTTGEHKEHLSVLEFKREKRKEELVELEQTIERV